MILFEKSTDIKRFLKKGTLAAATLGYWQRLMLAFIMHWGRMSASRAGEALRSDSRHRANVIRFLLKQQWSPNWLENYWQALLVLEQECQRDGLWLFILDQTCCSQQGQLTPNTVSTGNRQRRPCKGRRYGKKKYAKKSQHIFVMGLLITPGGLRLPISKPYYTKTYCQERSWTYCTQTELAAELIDNLQVPAGAQVIVLGDTAFEAKTIRHACAKRHYTWIVPLNPERVLAGAKPRPKVRTLLAQMTAQQFVPVRLEPTKGRFVAQRRLSACRLGPKVKTRTFYVHAETHAVHSVGTVQLAFSCKEQPSADKPIALAKILMTNNLRLSEAEIVEIYSLRWQIELFFKELKSTLGFDQYRFRRYEAVHSWVQLALLSFLYLEWQRGRKLRDRRVSEKEKAWWRAQRSYGLCRAVRQTAEGNDLAAMAQLIGTKTGRKKLAKRLRAALPPEYRAAA
jgi:hypothetical protein